MNITSGKIITAKKVVLYGTEGIGKSTFASRFPEPLFIDTEGSTKELDVRRFDKPTSWEMLKQQVQYVIQNRPCKTLVVDTIDWAEQLCIEAICSAHNKKGIEDFGYGNGYVFEKEEFGRFLNLLSDVVDNGIHVVLTAHAIIRKFEQPDELGAYDRYELKLGKKTTNMISPMVKEWADMVLFANYKTFAVATDDSGRKHKGQGGKRVLYTSHHPCWDAKNRYGLPDELPMDYEAIRPIIEPSQVVSGSNTAQDASKFAVLDSPNLNAMPDQVIESLIEETVPQPSQDNGVPKPLYDLMVANNITEQQIRWAVSSKGYFPMDMMIRDYPQEFIDGVLIGAWDQVKEIIMSAEDLPF